MLNRVSPTEAWFSLGATQIALNEAALSPAPRRVDTAPQESCDPPRRRWRHIPASPLPPQAPLPSARAQRPVIDWRAVQQPAGTLDCWVLAPLISYAYADAQFLASKLPTALGPQASVRSLYHPGDGAGIDVEFDLEEASRSCRIPLEPIAGRDTRWVRTFEVAVDTLLRYRPNYIADDFPRGIHMPAPASLMHWMLTGRSSKHVQIAAAHGACALWWIDDALQNGRCVEAKTHTLPVGHLVSVVEVRTEPQKRIAIVDPEQPGLRQWYSPELFAESFNHLCVGPKRRSTPTDVRRTYDPSRAIACCFSARPSAQSRGGSS